MTYKAQGNGIYKMPVRSQREDGTWATTMGFLVGRVEDNVQGENGKSPAELIADALNAMERDPVSLAAIQDQLDAVYAERNRLVALLARIYPSGIGKTDIEGWDPEWHNVVYIDSPMGQLSWHFHDRDAWMFSDLDFYPGTWDGHSTELKYERLASIWRLADMHRMAAGDRTYLKKGLQYNQDDAIHAIGLAAVAQALENPVFKPETVAGDAGTLICPSCGEPGRPDSDVTGLHPECPLPQTYTDWLAGTDDASSSSDT